MVAGPKLRCAGRRGGPLRLSRRDRLRRLSAGGFGRADHGRTEEGRSEHDQRGICGQARYAFEPCESRYLAGAGGRRPSAREGAVCAPQLLSRQARPGSSMAEARDHRLEAVGGVIEGLAPGLAPEHAGDAGRRVSALQRSDRGHVPKLDRFGTRRSGEYGVAKGAPRHAVCGLPQPGRQHGGTLPGGRTSGGGSRAAEVRGFGALDDQQWLCGRAEHQYLAPCYRWALVLDSLKTYHRKNHNAGRHPRSADWETTYGQPIPGDTCARQLGTVQRWYDAGQRNHQLARQVAYGTRPATAIEHAAGARSADDDWEQRLADALTAFRSCRWPLDYLHPATTAPATRT